MPVAASASVLTKVPSAMLVVRQRASDACRITVSEDVVGNSVMSAPTVLKTISAAAATKSVNGRPSKSNVCRRFSVN